MTYAPRRPPRVEVAKLRDLEFHLYHWTGRTRPAFLIHGWGDCAETWQFLIDHASEERAWLAPDLRGFGRTQRPDDGYWFPDYLADLDALIERVSPHAPIDLIGHSMGGNIALLYAGVKPGRVRRLVSLEGFGLARTAADEAPARYARWLDEVARGTEFATYDSFQQLEAVLARRNPRTPAERLQFIARSWARQRQDGRIELRADPRHKRVNPILYQRDQAEACWRAVTAPVLFVTGDQSSAALHLAEELSEERLRALFREVNCVTLGDTGHMLHHERPQELASLIEGFLGPA